MTVQGRAIKQAAIDFGDGRTLPFTPCKKGYAPVVDGVQKVACSLHEEARRKRLSRESEQRRKGEVDPMATFWCQSSVEDITEESG